MKTPIQHIIFDLGGVILNIDYLKTETAFEGIGFPNFNELYTQFKQSPLFVRFEKGEISAEFFLAELKKYGKQRLSNQDLIDAWNAMLLDLPLSHLDYLEKLKPHYQLFLLSNTNEIHYKNFFNHVEGKIGRRDLKPYFTREYYSHQIGKRKPDPEVFHHIINREGIQPENTLMIDDSPQHLETARAIGFQTFYKSQEQNLPKALESSGLL